MDKICKECGHKNSSCSIFHWIALFISIIPLSIFISPYFLLFVVPAGLSLIIWASCDTSNKCAKCNKPL